MNTAAYADDELSSLLLGGDSRLAERRRSAADRSAIRRSICAFANDLAGAGRPGVIFIGVEDDGRRADPDVDEPLLRELAQTRADGDIMPLPSMTIEKKTLAGRETAVVLVRPSASPPVRYQGRAWVKVGPTVRLASPEEERRLGERRLAARLPFDMQAAEGAVLDDLDLDFAGNRYLPRAIADDVLERDQRSIEQQLLSLRLTRDGSPTRGALLGLGRRPRDWVPGAYLQFARIHGRSFTDPIQDQKALSGRLDDVLRQLDEVLRINVSERTEIGSSGPEKRSPDYPVAALQQLSRNAVVHRSYEATNAPARIYWCADRVEIHNPGGLYGQVTPDNFGTGATDYRNPLVSEIMHNLGYAQRFGMGIPMAREALSENGNPPPEFFFEPTTICAVVRPAP